MVLLMLILWLVTMSEHDGRYQSFGGTYYLQLHGVTTHKSNIYNIVRTSDLINGFITNSSNFLH